MKLRHLLVLVVACVALAACSALLLPTVTPTPTPKPSFGIEELRNVFQNLPEGYVEVDPKSRELGSANFNDAFDLQLAFLDNGGRSRGFSVSLGILSPADREGFDYALEKQWGTADEDLIKTENVDRAIGLFWLDIGDISLARRHLQLPARSGEELREFITFRRGEVAIVVEFAQEVHTMRVFGTLPKQSDISARDIQRISCGGAYICFEGEPDFVTGPQAARMIDEAIVQFYGDRLASE